MDAEAGARGRRPSSTPSPSTPDQEEGATFGAHSQVPELVRAQVQRRSASWLGGRLGLRWRKES